MSELVDVFGTIEDRLNTIEQSLRRIVRVGIVTEIVDKSKFWVRVEFRDVDKVHSYVLPVIQHVPKYPPGCPCKCPVWLPNVGEEVLCIFLPYGVSNGFVAGAYFR